MSTDQKPLTNLTLEVVEATGFFERLRGLIGRRLAPNQALLFRGYNSLHTCFMSYNLDILFLDEHNTVIRVVKGLKPWRFCLEKKAKHFLEIPSDRTHDLRLGLSIDLNNACKGIR